MFFFTVYIQTECNFIVIDTRVEEEDRVKESRTDSHTVKKPAEVLDEYPDPSGN